MPWLPAWYSVADTIDVVQVSQEQSPLVTSSCIHRLVSLSVGAKTTRHLPMPHRHLSLVLRLGP